MVDVLRVTLGMHDVGGVALPIHDAILVPASGVDVAKNVMTYTFWLKTGLEGVVDVLTAEDFEDTQSEAA